MRTTISISIRGDDAFVKRLRKLAAMREQEMADLTRAAIDQAYGSDMAALDDFSLASGVPHTEQSSVKE